MFSDLTPLPVIDSHVHVFPPEISDALQKWFETYAWPLRYTGTAEEALERLFDNGAAGAVLLSYSHRPGIADQLNEFTAQLIKRFPHTAGLAAIHPHDAHPKDILKRAFDQFGLCGAKIHCHVLKTAPDDPALFPVYEAVLERGGVLTIHAGREPHTEGYGIDVRTITGVERVENVLERYPSLKMIVPHLGFDESERFYSLLDTFPNLYLDTTMVLGGFFDVEVNSGNLIRYADRILYGSDYPNIPYGMCTEVDSLLALNLGEDTTRKILFENAASLFPIKARS